MPTWLAIIFFCVALTVNISIWGSDLGRIVTRLDRLIDVLEKMKDLHKKAGRN